MSQILRLSRVANINATEEPTMTDDRVALQTLLENRRTLLFRPCKRPLHEMETIAPFSDNFLIAVRSGSMTSPAQPRIGGARELHSITRPETSQPTFRVIDAPVLGCFFDRCLRRRAIGTLVERIDHERCVTSRSRLDSGLNGHKGVFC